MPKVTCPCFKMNLERLGNGYGLTMSVEPAVLTSNSVRESAMCGGNQAPASGLRFWQEVPTNGW